MADLAALSAAIEAGNRTASAELTREALDEGVDPETILGRDDRPRWTSSARSSRRASCSSPRCSSPPGP